MKSKFSVAKKRRSVGRFAEKDGGRGERAAAWGVLYVWLTEIGWVLSVAGMVSIGSPLAHSRTELMRTGHSRA